MLVKSCLESLGVRNAFLDISVVKLHFLSINYILWRETIIFVVIYIFPPHFLLLASLIWILPKNHIYFVGPFKIDSRSVYSKVLWEVFVEVVQVLPFHVILRVSQYRNIVYRMRLPVLRCSQFLIYMSARKESLQYTPATLDLLFLFLFSKKSMTASMDAIMQSREFHV